VTVSSGEHDAMRESLGFLALGKLAEHERGPVLDHADGCPDCSAELDAFLELAALLRPGPARDATSAAPEVSSLG
jgi:hypothetical protein